MSSTKRKLSPSPPETPQHFHIESLPINCLEEIFSYLRWNELVNITLTSEYFNSVVSGSSKVLDFVQFYFRPYSISSVQESIRHYSNFYISGECSDANFETFMEIFGHRLESIKRLNVQLYCVRKREIVNELLKRCKNLKRVEISGEIRSEEKFLKMDEEKSKLKLDFLKIDGDYENLKFFEASTVKKLVIRKSNPEKLENFLKLQENLENLVIEHFNDYSRLNLDEFKFKLKELTLKDCQTNPSLREFLKRHQKTLRTVTIQGIVASNMINALSGLPDLNLKIHFNMKNFEVSEPLQTMSNVTDLEILCDHNEIEFSHFDGKFPNIKKLRLSDFRSNFKPTAVFENLEELRLEKTTLKFPLKIPKVKKLQLAHVTFQMIRNPIDFEDNSIEEIELDNCFFFAWFFAFLECDETKLKFVRLNQSRKDIRKEILKKNAHKIKRLRTFHYFSL